VARARLEELWRSRTGVISTQVLQEFYVVVTRKFEPAFSKAKARDVVDAYSGWPTVVIDPSLIVAASLLEERHKLSFWDALIVEAARVAGAATLLTEDSTAARASPVSASRTRSSGRVTPRTPPVAWPYDLPRTNQCWKEAACLSLSLSVGSCTPTSSERSDRTRPPR